ncbi:MAG: DUF1064 domain-containing protein [Clostridium sp.]|nr:DUF1064 domain-containing protein [Clostridium sp.]
MIIKNTNVINGKLCNNNKYHNKKVIYNGIKFDSKKERARFITLKQLEKMGIIESLELQKKFLLQEGYTNAKGKKIRPIYYIADFYYYDYIDNKWVVEDVKGVRTDVYKLKKKLFEYKYNLTIDEL